MDAEAVWNDMLAFLRGQGKEVVIPDDIAADTLAREDVPLCVT